MVLLQVSARELALEAAVLGLPVADPIFNQGIGHALCPLTQLIGTSVGRSL